MNKEELIVELENNDVQVNIDDTRMTYCNSLDKELVKAIYNLQQENDKLKLNHKQLSDIEKTMISNSRLIQENKQLKEKLNKIETLTINHNCDIGDIYYKYNGKYLKSEFKENILEILYGGKNE